MTQTIRSISNWAVTNSPSEFSKSTHAVLIENYRYQISEWKVNLRFSPWDYGSVIRGSQSHPSQPKGGADGNAAGRFIVRTTDRFLTPLLFFISSSLPLFEIIQSKTRLGWKLRRVLFCAHSHLRLLGNGLSLFSRLFFLRCFNLNNSFITHFI